LAFAFFFPVVVEADRPSERLPETMLDINTASEEQLKSMTWDW
jgi:DNA uptake protein ComE-like DNA-binding protein